ncbi:MAG: CotH kinase family protein [Anaerolineae bacterium]|nr:CotH kinase family protein [Anaerolineae bacterium]
MIMRRIAFVLLALVTVGVLVACGAVSADDQASAAVSAVSADSTVTAVDADTDDVARPEGWNDATHSNSAEPNYDVVFPDDEVNRIDITISAENWQLMLDDMTALYGEQGSSGGFGGLGGGRPAGGLPEGGPPDRLPPGGTPPDGTSPGGTSPDGTSPDGALPGDGARPQGGQPGGFGGGFGPGLEESTENPIWVEATVEFEGDVWTNVGIRFKGNSSLRSTWSSGDLKMPFKLDFDEFEDAYPEIDNQRFYGFKQLSLSSNFGDESYLRETVAYDLFEEMGVVSAETAFYELYLDYGEGPVYVGLYTMVEIVDDTVIETNFDDDSGNVYKPDGLSAAFAAESFDATTLDKETNQDEADFSDVQALYTILHADLRTSDAAAWRSELETVFDVDAFARWLAVNTVIQNWDTYGVAYHNYYLYTDPTTGLITWIPWDNNESLSSDGRMGMVALDLSNVSDAWPLISYLMADEVYYDLYVGYVDQFAATVDSAELETGIRALAEMIRPSVAAEQAVGFDTAVQQLVDHIANRLAAAAAFAAE